MRQNRLIAIFTYLLLIAGCMGIVFIADKAAGTGPFYHTKKEAESDLPDDGKVGDGSGISSGESKETEETSEKEQSLLLPEENREESQGAGGRRKWYTSRRRPQVESEAVLKEEEPKGPPKLILATDIHYMSSKLTDYSDAFETFIAKDDGKVVRYSSELVDAFLQEALEYRPDAVILSGDLTVDGEKINHQELSLKLSGLQQSGIQVLVIPGNHDINNPNASSYIGEKKAPAEQVTPEEFYDIYRAFGYDQAESRDESSLSYRYNLDDTHWLLMLDSCQYEPYNKVGGRISPETYVWIQGQYAEAKEAGAVLIPVAHHNLMGQSRVYPTECAIEGGEELITIMEENQVPLYLSGHLHLQRIKKFRMEPGDSKKKEAVTEAITASLSIAPCQYGVIEWKEDGSMDYSLKTVDVSAWAAANRIEDENLLDFETYSEEFVKNVVSNQVYKKLDSLPEDMKQRMAAVYGQVNYEYCAGEAADKEEIKDSEGYRLWERNGRDSRELALIDKMMADLKEDNISWESYPGSIE